MIKEQRIIKSDRADFQYTEIVLHNGLKIVVAPMEGYTGVHAVYGTYFGSVDREFEHSGVKHTLPAGIAHFLEHKMFENEDGDAFSLYAKTGASANAYTSFDKTCYIFTATQNIEESLDILLSFVSKPYFTEATVKKEQGIIGQEIKMYDDSPEWRIMFAMLQSIYSNSYVKDDIAGTVESISEITPTMLYKCCNAFYNPQNMVLSVAGNITVAQVMAAVEKSEINFDSKPLDKILPEESMDIVRKEHEIEMTVACPMLGLAYKCIPYAENKRHFGEVVTDMVIELVTGDSTPLFKKLYDTSLINGSFGGESLSGVGYNCVMFTGETSNPKKVRQELLAEISRLKEVGINEEDFEICRNLMYGECISEFESIQNVAGSMADAAMQSRTLFDHIEIIAAVTVKNINDAIKTMFDEDNLATVIINPVSEKR